MIPELINSLCKNVLPTIAAPVLVSFVTSFFITKWNNKHYLRNHSAEIDQDLLNQAPSIRKESYGQFQQRTEEISYWANIDVSGSGSEDPPTRHTNECCFFQWVNSQEILKRSRQWVAITILNTSNLGLQITSISTHECKNIPISNSIGSLIDPCCTVTYLFTYRDAPLEIHAKFDTRDISYVIPAISGFCRPEFWTRQPD